MKGGGANNKKNDRERPQSYHRINEGHSTIPKLGTQFFHLCTFLKIEYLTGPLSDLAIKYLKLKMASNSSRIFKNMT